MTSFTFTSLTPQLRLLQQLQMQPPLPAKLLPTQPRSPAGKQQSQRQHGQALVEALIAFLVLLALWIAVAWLGRYQDIALQATHASRYIAFDQARGQSLNEPLARREFFARPSHQWTDRKGRKLFDNNNTHVHVTAVRQENLESMAQPGQESRHAETLRHEWALADGGVLDTQVALEFAPSPELAHQAPSFMSGLRDFDRAYPRLHRHTAIVVDVGSAVDDSDVQARVAQGRLAWSDAAQQSYRLRRQINSTMQVVDASWGRPAPSADWLSAWTGDVPIQHRLRSGDQP